MIPSRDPATGTFISGDAATRFWAKVDKRRDGCWEWTSVRNKQGYGMFKATRDGVWKYVRAHRYAYELVVGPIAAGQTLDHLCGRPWCVRPDHLEQCSIAENIRRGMPRSKQLAARAACDAGHPYDERNTYVTPDGARRCRACQALAARRYKANRKRR